MLLIFTFCSNVLAINLKYEGKEYTLPEIPDFPSGYDNYFIFYSTSFQSGATLCFFKSGTIIYNNSNYIDFNCTGSNTFYTYSLNCVLSSSTSSSRWISDGTSTQVRYSKGYGFSVYTTEDIKNSSGNVVFQKAPVTVGTIPKITQVEEIPQVMGEVLKVIIPIGLIIFGIGLLILLVRLVISRMT